MSFENKVEEILRTAESNNSVKIRIMEVVGTTITNLVERLNNKNINTTVTKSSEESVVPAWSIEVEGYEFVIQGHDIIHTSELLKKDVEQVVVDKFLDELKEAVEEEKL